jgi:hypothetical protein
MAIVVAVLCGGSEALAAEGRRPELSFEKDGSLTGGKRLLDTVRGRFPDVPGFAFDAWCYESPLTLVEHRRLAGGVLELRHRVNDAGHVLLVTTVTPEPGAVEFSARAQLDPQHQPGARLPNALPVPNLCWQVRRAEGFKSAPDPYPEFIKRCFIFTEKGRTFLDQTTRRKLVYRDPPLAPDAPQNNPPWVQAYVGTWQEVLVPAKGFWANYSPDRYTIPVIGVVSRDGKHLAALASGSASEMAQAWHDCLHNNPPWEPAGASPAERRWRVKVYVMANNPARLLERVKSDFPAAGTPSRDSEGQTPDCLASAIKSRHQ